MQEDIHNGYLDKDGGYIDPKSCKHEHFGRIISAIRAIVIEATAEKKPENTFYVMIPRVATFEPPLDKMKECREALSESIKLKLKDFHDNEMVIALLKDIERYKTENKDEYGPLKNEFKALPHHEQLQIAKVLNGEDLKLPEKLASFLSMHQIANVSTDKKPN